MNWYKTSQQTIIKLKKDKNDRNNRVIYYLEGNTYPLRQQLGARGLNFRWYGPRKIWWLYEEQMSPEKLSKMQKLGIDISEIQKIETTPKTEPSTTKPEEPQEELTNKTDSDEGKEIGRTRVPSSRYYGFPIKKNIYTTPVEVNIDDKQIPLTVSLDRWYIKNERKIPLYIYNFKYKDNLIRRKSFRPEGAWRTYDEDTFARDIPRITQEIANKKGKLYNAINAELQLEQRNPELVKLLSDWDNAGYNEGKRFIDNYIGIKTIHLSEPKYEGDYNLELQLLGDNHIYINTRVDHPLAGRAQILTTFYIPPNIKNIEEFNNFINQQIIENNDQISERYIDYLKSFPFLQEEQEKTRKNMQEVVNMIGTQYDISFFKGKLAELGYIRPSKKVKREEVLPGMMPQGRVKWVLESKKITNDTRSYRHDTNSFYAVIAYWLHRKVKNISSWTDMALVDAISYFHGLTKKYEHEISFKEIEKYFNEISSALYKELFDKEPPRTVEENWSDFYGRGSGQTGGGQTENRALSAFVNFVSQYGIDTNLAINNPKQVYRILVKKFHPDLNPKQTKEELQAFKDLDEFYSRLPIEMTVKANNWFHKIKT